MVITFAFHKIYGGRKYDDVKCSSCVVLTCSSSSVRSFGNWQTAQWPISTTNWHWPSAARKTMWIDDGRMFWKLVCGSEAHSCLILSLISEDETVNCSNREKHEKQKLIIWKHHYYGLIPYYLVSGMLFQQEMFGHSSLQMFFDSWCEKDLMMDFFW